MQPEQDTTQVHDDEFELEEPPTIRWARRPSLIDEDEKNEQTETLRPPSPRGDEHQEH
ncbi:MAG TPA: hypothetical protein VF881_14760 [Polyangiaceae bacterium]